MTVPEKTFEPAAAAPSTAWSRFRARIVEAGHIAEAHDALLHRWACDNPAEFWPALIEFLEVPRSGSLEPAVVNTKDIEHAQFFPNLELNYAEVLLRDADDSQAVVAVNEAGERQSITRKQLRQRVEALRSALADVGIGAGDRVAAIVRNDLEAIVSSLAVVSLGASWSSTSPDFAADAIVSRFAQLEPTALFTVSGYLYHGVSRGIEDKLRTVVKSLPENCTIIRIDDAELAADVVGGRDQLVARELEQRGVPSVPWARFPFNQPLFIMFSSGTTGAPKCIVHGAGGTLIEHLKEHVLHGELKRDDLLYFQTSCGWMMWNWQLSALATGAAILVYDGSVTHPCRDALWKIVEREQVTILGTSPPYLQYCHDAGISPGSALDLSSLRAIQSTGSILFGKYFGWVKVLGADLPLQSISGGTDIIGCFVLGHSERAVYCGESQSISLGLDVRAAVREGDEVRFERHGHGELVCVNPFPSRPVGFYGDPDGERFHAAYFLDHPGVWTHGDFIELTDRGTARILGRSDGVMNIRGIRIGPAEIYGAVNGIEAVSEMLAVELRADGSGRTDNQLVLLLVMADGHELDRKLTLAIKKQIKQRTSSVHVPSVVAAVSQLPRTFSGKLSERAARDAVNGKDAVNRAALANPESLEEIRKALS